MRNHAHVVERLRKHPKGATSAFATSASSSRIPVKFVVPTCDDARSPTLKAFVHAATAVLHVVIVAYHLRNFFFHWSHRSNRSA